MTPLKPRGALLEINAALNRPTTKFGMDYRILGVCLFLSIAMFLLASKILACLLLPGLIATGAGLTRKDPQMFSLWILSFRLAAHYDPGK
jgi:type IV secretory pathway VirB3-like protein